MLTKCEIPSCKKYAMGKFCEMWLCPWCLQRFYPEFFAVPYQTEWDTPPSNENKS